MVSEAVRSELDLPADDCFANEIVDDFKGYSLKICELMVN